MDIVIFGLDGLIELLLFLFQFFVVEVADHQHIEELICHPLGVVQFEVLLIIDELFRVFL